MGFVQNYIYSLAYVLIMATTSYNGGPTYSVDTDIEGCEEDYQMFDCFDDAMDYYDSMVDEMESNQNLQIMDWTVTLYDCVLNDVRFIKEHKV